MENYVGANFWTFIGKPVSDALLAAGVPGPIVSTLFVLVGVAGTLGVLTVLVMYAVLLERKFIARLQDRYGPNRVGPYGLLQAIADPIKLLGKEIATNSRVDKVLHFIAPVIVLGASLMVWAVIPWGPGLQVVDINVALLYLLAFSSIPALGVTLAGWGSYNKYSLLGGMRAVVQYVSYEVPAGIVLLIPVLFAGTLSLQGIVQAQSGPFWNWFIFKPIIFFPIIGVLAFIWFIIAGLAETNRTPFDHVEADSELTGGFTTEYSGMQFALFFLAEYANAIVVALMASSLFLGGYHTGLGEAVDALLWPFLPGVLFTKAVVIFLVFVWIRGTLPRFRYDQLMGFAWKRMLPVALLLVAASVVVLPFVRPFAAAAAQ